MLKNKNTKNYRIYQNTKHNRKVLEREYFAIEQTNCQMIWKIINAQFQLRKWNRIQNIKRQIHHICHSKYGKTFNSGEFHFVFVTSPN